MRYLPLLFLCFSFVMANGNRLGGTISDVETFDPLSGAIISIDSLQLTISSDEDGVFLFPQLPEGLHTVSIEYLGYHNYTIKTPVPVPEGTLQVHMVPRPLRTPLQTVVASRARANQTAASFSTLTREQLAETYHTQDIPVMLGTLPSVTFYSESGNGVGYNYMSIRGFDQRRLAIMINGVPQNDPEDHNTYWIDLPDFLDSVEDIQVQRGAGSSFFGPPAIGGSVNILTSAFDPTPAYSAYAGVGSFGTQKLSFSANSGLIKDKFILNGRVSQLTSDGYRDRSWVDFKSYFLSGAYVGESTTAQIHLYGGPIEDGLVYGGVAKFAGDDRELRRQNLAWFVTDSTGEAYAFSGQRREDEIENFDQPHLDLIHRWQVNDRLSVNNTLFGIRGYGFFDYDGSWAPFSYFRLTPEYGFDVAGDPEFLYTDDLLIRAYVDNRQIGWLPNIKYDTGKMNFTAGAELRRHRSLHWGKIQKGSGLPYATSGDWQGTNYVGNRRYYEYDGSVDVYSPFVHTSYDFNSRVSTSLDVQFANSRYRLHNEEFIGTEFELNYHFANPRLGLRFHASPATTIYAAVARTSREPRLKSHYDAAEASTPASWGGVTPNFELRSDGSYNFDNPLVTPESLTDLELGFATQIQALHFQANAYYMDFRDEIIKTGQLDRFGQPITGNAEQTRHMGIELIAGIEINQQLHIHGNAAFSQNTLEDYTVFDGAGNPIVLDGNTINGFPNTLGNLGITYRRQNLNMSLQGRYVGKFYTDNFESELNSVDSHTVFNGAISYSIDKLPGLSRLLLQFHVQNIFDTLYFAHGSGDQFFPAAERQFFVNTRIEL